MPQHYLMNEIRRFCTKCAVLRTNCVGLRNQRVLNNVLLGPAYRCWGHIIALKDAAPLVFRPLEPRDTARIDKVTAVGLQKPER